MTSAELSTLLDIAVSADAAAQARLGQALAAERATLADLAQLDRADGATGDPMTPRELAVGAAHARWKALRRESLLLRQARQRAVVEEARMEAARALGRKEALAALRDAARHEDRRIRAARAAEQLHALPRSLG